MYSAAYDMALICLSVHLNVCHVRVLFAVFVKVVYYKQHYDVS